MSKLSSISLKCIKVFKSGLKVFEILFKKIEKKLTTLFPMITIENFLP